MALPPISSERLPSGHIAHSHCTAPAPLSTYSQRVYSIRPSFITVGKNSLRAFSDSRCKPVPSALIRWRFVPLIPCPEQSTPCSPRVEANAMRPSGR